MTLLAVTGSGWIYLGIVLAVTYVLVLLVALAYNVVRDARRRSTSILFAMFAFLLAFIPPFLGALIYQVIKPPRTLDQRALALEEQILSEPAGLTETRPCPPVAGISRPSS